MYCIFLIKRGHFARAFVDYRSGISFVFAFSEFLVSRVLCTDTHLLRIFLIEFSLNIFNQSLFVSVCLVCWMRVGAVQPSEGLDMASTQRVVDHSAILSAQMYGGFAPTLELARMIYSLLLLCKSRTLTH